jgi:proteic killer suppression protein
MIESFKHKGLKLLYERGDRSRLDAQFIAKIERILALLDVSLTAEEMNLPGFKLHPLKGELDGFWSVTVSANWRIIFRFENGSALDVDYVDYH